MTLQCSQFDPELELPSVQGFSGSSSGPHGFPLGSLVSSHLKKTCRSVSWMVDYPQIGTSVQMFIHNPGQGKVFTNEQMKIQMHGICKAMLLKFHLTNIFFPLSFLLSPLHVPFWTLDNMGKSRWLDFIYTFFIQTLSIMLIWECRKSQWLSKWS